MERCIEMINNLQLLLDDVISEYGENKGYYKPTISWSKFNRLSSFGEYKYWENAIEISPFLNDKRISIETLKSVIYHEYLHQMYFEHNNGFRKKENMIPNVKEHQKILNDFFMKINDLPIREVKRTLDYNDDIVFCLLSDAKIDEYLLSTYACNFNYYINLGSKVILPNKMLNKAHDVIWLVREQDFFFVIGISKDVSFLKENKTVSMEPICPDKFSFQATCEIEKTSFFMENGCNIPSNLFPKKFDKGFIYASEITDFLVSDVIDYINSYDCDLHVTGFAKSALHSIAPLVEKDYKKLIELSYKEKSFMRAVWIANKAKMEFDCFETRLCLANCLLNALLFDAAIEEYSSLLEQYPDDDEVDRKINIANSVLHKFQSQ